MGNKRSHRIGRNDKCPCGSGSKYKRCHGADVKSKPSSAEFHEAPARFRAKQLQAEQQQGSGRPIISGEFDGTRFVAVGPRLMASPRWKTFHDFLNDYIRDVFGADWGNAELQKPFEQRHPVLQWYHHVCIHQQKFIKVPGEVATAPTIGAAAAYLTLAYDLYSLAHNAEIQARLINRLKDIDQFPGARYETFVAAAMIRAGFELEFEDEQDGSVSHCEFTAKSKFTGRKFSVEAKHREPTDQSGWANFRWGKRLQKALRKNANHQRIVFIDINVPDDATDSQVPDHLRSALTSLRRFEGRLIDGKPLPSAYLFLTNFPFRHDLEGSIFRCATVAEGFQIADFKSDVAFPTLRHALIARAAHKDMHRLAVSIRTHAHPPSTFDGEIPEFAFRKSTERLLVGQRYLVPDAEGREQPGILTTAMVSESEKVAYCNFILNSGVSVIVTCPMSESEIAACKQYPDTFFGAFIQAGKKIESPLEFYDTLFEIYKTTPQERLLQFMAGASDHESLKTLSQQELASIYCERLVYGAMVRQSLPLATSEDKAC